MKQPDQLAPATAPRAAIEDDAVQMQGVDIHRNPDGSVAFVDEARALVQEQARLKALRGPVSAGDVRTIGGPADDAPVVRSRYKVRRSFTGRVNVWDRDGRPDLADRYR
jgi:hypothetical protein